MHIHDPGLTLAARKDAALLHSDFHAPFDRSKINYILSSPMKRCLETAVIGCKPILYHPQTNPDGIKIVSWPKLREEGYGDPFTVGSPASKHVKEFPGVLDCTLMSPDWMENSPEDDCANRVKLVRAELFEFGRQAMIISRKGRKCKLNGSHWKHIKFTSRKREAENVEILVFSYHEFLEYLTGDGFTWAVPKTYQFAPVGKVGPSFRLVETEEGRERSERAILTEDPDQEEKLTYASSNEN